jgi:hypothetical protein
MGGFCGFQHDNYLTVNPKELEKLCIYYPFGLCEYGDKCPNNHCEPLFLIPIKINYRYDDETRELTTLETFDLLTFIPHGYTYGIMTRDRLINRNLILAIHEKENHLVSLIYGFYCKILSLQRILTEADIRKYLEQNFLRPLFFLYMKQNSYHINKINKTVLSNCYCPPKIIT